MGQYPDFVKLADAYGATGIRLADKNTLVDDIREAIATEGPVLVDVRVTREENTYPMIPAGQPARNMGGRLASQAQKRSCHLTNSKPSRAFARAASTCCRSWSRTSPAS